MIQATWMELFKFLLMLFALAGSSDFANSQIPASQLDNPTAPNQSASESVKTLDPLAEQNRQLEKQNQELMNQIVSFRQILTRQAGSVSEADVTYKMAAFDGGLKYRGYSLEEEYFLRWLDHFHGTGTAGLAPMFSHGFQRHTSAMVLPKTLQLYFGGSTLYGKYGNPWDFWAGVSLFPFHNRVVRWNNEFLYLHKSPVG